ncbi:DUF2971 domain-containing protein [Roseobacter sp. HKCCA0434]|uniref:DUF2971 domain-containing protein n=1 Tax=Roseobacter sp. HKCCA0434 TaxID=3079297 RepID=UPI00290587AE|nr:DUF2971 domain-containing protein [Roseobacter sp. HKCCA0434]
MSRIFDLQDILFASEKQHKAKLIAEGNLAHYTGADTALSILQDQELWLTNVAGMNDLSECRYAHGLLRDLLSEDHDLGRRLARVMPLLATGLRMALDDDVGPLSLERIRRDSHIVCFGEESHAEQERGRLSMWRGYGRKTLVRLTFASAALDAGGPSPGQPIVRVLYGETQACDELERIVEGFEAHHIDERSVSTVEIGHAVIRFIVIAILAIKHPSFEEEREWRLIHHPLLDPDREVVTTKALPIRERVELVKVLRLSADERFLHAGLKDILHSVTIGPSSETELTKDAFEAVLAHPAIGLPGRVSVADIPYRGG